MIVSFSWNLSAFSFELFVIWLLTCNSPRFDIRFFFIFCRWHGYDSFFLLSYMHVHYFCGYCYVQSNHATSKKKHCFWWWWYGNNISNVVSVRYRWMTFKLYNVSMMACIRVRPQLWRDIVWTKSLSKQMCTILYVFVGTRTHTSYFWLMLQSIPTKKEKKRRNSAYFTCCWCRYGCFYFILFPLNFWLNAFRWRIFMLCVIWCHLSIQHRMESVYAFWNVFVHDSAHTQHALSVLHGILIFISLRLFACCFLSFYPFIGFFLLLLLLLSSHWFLNL